MNGRHLLFFFLIFPAFLQARDAHWYATNGDWDNPANWLGGYIPTENDRVYIAGGKYVVTVNHPVTVAYLYISDFTLNGTGTLRIMGNMEYGSMQLEEATVRFDSVLIYGQLRVREAFGTFLRFPGADVILYGGADLQDGSFKTDSGSLYIPRGSMVDFNYYDEPNGSLEANGGKIVNDGTIRYHNEKPLWMWDYPPHFLLVIHADTIRNYGVIENVSGDLQLYGSGFHKKGTLRAGVNSFMSVGCRTGGVQLLDSTVLSAREIHFGCDTIKVSQHSSVTAPGGGLSNAVGSCIVDSSSQLNISDLYLYGSSRLFQLSHDLTINTFIQEGGTLAGPGNITVTGNARWYAGQVGSRFAFLLAGNLSYFGTATPYIINRRKVVLGSQSNWLSPFIKLANGAYIDIPYNKTLIVTPTPGVSGNSVSNTDSTGSFLANYGTFILRNPVRNPGTLTINSTFKNARVLTIENGTLKLNGIFNNLGNVRGAGVLDIRGAQFNNKGTFTPHVSSPGVLTVLGNYRNHIFLADIKSNKGLTGIPGNDPAPGHDHLSVSDSIQLSGSTLRVRETGTVAPGRFVIMKCQGGPGCRVGDFAITELPYGYSIDYTDTSVSLVKVAASLNSKATAMVIEGKSVFKVTVVAGNRIQMATSGQQDIVQIISPQGRVVKTLTVSGTGWVTMPAASVGVFVVHNITQHTSRKINIHQ